MLVSAMSAFHPFRTLDFAVLQPPCCGIRAIGSFASLSLQVSRTHMRACVRKKRDFPDFWPRTAVHMNARHCEHWEHSEGAGAVTESIRDVGPVAFQAQAVRISPSLRAASRLLRNRSATLGGSI
jgi:hypothetical protein